VDSLEPPLTGKTVLASDAATFDDLRVFPPPVAALQLEKAA
jgi:hypothetical protein